MSKYQNGKIYKITCDDNDLVYYGSTYSKLTKRLCEHKSSYKNFLKGGSCNWLASFDIVKYVTCKIELVEDFPCNSKYELYERERFFIENNECNNKKTPNTTINCTPEEYHRKYYIKNTEKINKLNNKWKQDNKESYKSQQKKYRELNKEQINKRTNRKIKCECGDISFICNLSRHKKSTRHKYFVEHGKLPDVVDNMTCTCGATFQKSALIRHLKTKKHLDG
jgi:hypothetical protein